MKRIPIAQPIDRRNLFRRFARRPGCVWLDSALQAHGLGRHSYLCSDPVKTFRFAGGEAVALEGGQSRSLRGDPFELLRAELRDFCGEEKPGQGFSHGAIGYFSYDIGRCIERIPSLALDEGAPEARFNFYDGCVRIDEQAGLAEAVGRDEQAARRAWEAAMGEGREVEANEPAGGEAEPWEGPQVRRLTTPQGYREAVARIRELISRGEVYQVNLSQRFELPRPMSPPDLYWRLRAASPAAYAAYMDFGDEQILSSSPELFLSKEGRQLETRPIKGTRPRGRDGQEDERMREELRRSEKERAELLMIVDLERNDLGRVCQPGSIEALDLFRIEDYETVIHQTARIRGRLREGLDSLDGLRAMLPGGSITGAPKVRAMQVIESLEPVRRGIYTGLIGFLDASGDAHFNIAIRTLRCSGNRVTFNVGGGVVWDSDPQLEYEETLHKAEGMARALGVRL